MKNKPDKWEVVCTRCLAGLEMSDTEVSRRLYTENIWPKHCGKVMMLRRILVENKNLICSHTGCNFAINARCSCDCEGRYHGVNNETIYYEKPIVAEKPWWKKPIRELITV